MNTDRFPGSKAQELLDDPEYWALRLRDDVWLDYISDMVASTFKDDIADGDIFLCMHDGSLFYFILKARLPIEVLSFKFGIQPEIIKKAEFIDLGKLPMEGEPGIEPTVQYFGHA